MINAVFFQRDQGTKGPRDERDERDQKDGRDVCYVLSVLGGFSVLGEQRHFFIFMLP